MAKVLYYFSYPVGGLLRQRGYSNAGDYVRICGAYRQITAGDYSHPFYREILDADQQLVQIISSDFYVMAGEIQAYHITVFGMQERSRQ